MSKPNLALTRVANACVLLELDGHAVLTDPWFTERWYLRRGEPLGLPVASLPPLAAIVVSNAAVNHWDLRALAAGCGPCLGRRSSWARPRRWRARWRWARLATPSM